MFSSSWSRDVVNIPYASPPKRKLFAFNFEASRGLGQEIGNTHQERYRRYHMGNQKPYIEGLDNTMGKLKDKQWPTKDYTDWATLILQKRGWTTG